MMRESMQKTEDMTWHDMNMIAWMCIEAEQCLCLHCFQGSLLYLWCCVPRCYSCYTCVQDVVLQRMQESFCNPLIRWLSYCQLLVIHALLDWLLSTCNLERYVCKVCNVIATYLSFCYCQVNFGYCNVKVMLSYWAYMHVLLCRQGSHCQDRGWKLVETRSLENIIINDRMLHFLIVLPPRPSCLSEPVNSQFVSVLSTTDLHKCR